MRYYDLFENILNSEFTIGFELECITDNKDKLLNLYNSIFTNINSTYKMNIGTDDTIDIKNYENNFNAYELKSQEFNIIPTNISKIIKFLNELNKHNIFTNESCGFHVHIKYPTYDMKDGYWILLNLSTDNDMLNKLINFKKYKFFNEKYANLEFLNKLKNNVLTKNNNIEYVPYSMLKPHHLNTLEWRGPRNFLNEPNINEIKDFFKLLYEFVRWISDTVSKKELNSEKKDFWTKNVKNNISDKLNYFITKIIKDQDKTYIEKLNKINDDNLINILKYEEELIKYINNPSGIVQKYIFDNHKELINFIKNPTIPELLNK